MKYSSKTLKQYTYTDPYGSTVTLTLTRTEYELIRPYIKPTETPKQQHI